MTKKPENVEKGGKPEDSKKKSGIFSGRRTYLFVPLVLFFLSILVPYAYYSIKVYNYIHSDDRLNVPDGPVAPNDPRSAHYTDLWISFASAFVLICLKEVFMNIGKPLVRAVRIRKPDESDEMEGIQI